MTAREERRKKRQQEIDRRNQEIEKNRGKGRGGTKDPIFLNFTPEREQEIKGELDKGATLEETLKQPESTKGRTLQEQRENLPDTAGGKLLKFISSPKLTAFLATTLATLGLGALIGGGAAAAGAVGRGAAAARGATGVITRTATRGLGARSVSMTTQRAFTGRAATSQKILRLFKNPKTRAINTRYASNSKSQILTKSFFRKLAVNPNTYLAAIGTYPFAGFIKEEALQTLDFGIRTAEENDDLEGFALALEEKERLLDPTVTDRIIQAVPFANIVKKLRDYFKAARVKLEIDKTRFAQALEGLDEDVIDEFTQSRIDTRQRQLEERAEDAEYFRLIREGKYEEAQALLDLQLQGGG